MNRILCFVLYLVRNIIFLIHNSDSLVDLNEINKNDGGSIDFKDLTQIMAG